MENIKTFTAATQEELWQAVAVDMANQGQVLQYAAHLQQPDQDVYFDIDIDLGGGFESGFSTTNFLAPVAGNSSLRFHFYRQDWVNEIGIVFGMEDTKLGYEDLDAAFIIKTNQPETLQALFSDPDLRAFLLKHPNADLEFKQDDEETGLLLTFSKDEAILDVTVLREIYHWLRELALRVA